MLLSLGITERGIERNYTYVQIGAKLEKISEGRRLNPDKSPYPAEKNGIPSIFFATPNYSGHIPIFTE
jgi:hypothetical protein